MGNWVESICANCGNPYERQSLYGQVHKVRMRVRVRGTSPRTITRNAHVSFCPLCLEKRKCRVCGVRFERYPHPKYPIKYVCHKDETVTKRYAREYEPMRVCPSCYRMSKCKQCGWKFDYKKAGYVRRPPLCPSCKAERRKQMCYVYVKRYRNAHPDRARAIERNTQAKKALRFKTDPTYREHVRARQREWAKRDRVKKRTLKTLIESTCLNTPIGLLRDRRYDCMHYNARLSRVVKERPHASNVCPEGCKFYRKGRG
jgi:hypothetical protein